MTDTNILSANIKELIKTSSGKEFVWAILETCGVYSSSYSNDNNLSSYLNGKRDVGLEVLRWLDEADATIYPNLILSNLDID